MKIKNFKIFVESISGTELIGNLGPGFPSDKSPNTIDKHDTTVLYSDITGQMYTEDDYNDLYSDYLKTGKKPLTSGFNKENLDEVLKK
jgi:hypothetical protein